MKNSKLRNVTAVMAKIIEVLGWFGTACIAIGSALIVIFNDEIVESYNSGVMEANNASLNVTGGTTEQFMQMVEEGNGAYFFIPFLVVCVLSTLIFRNIYNIFKKSNTESPFAESNIKRIKNIGIYAIAIPVCKIVLYAIFAALSHSSQFYFSISLSEVVFGLVALCLSQYFAYGAQLENDVEGLL